MQQKSDEISHGADDKATSDEDSSDAETADPSQQDATEVVLFSKHPQSIETILGGEVSVPPQQHSTQTTATQSETHEECSEASPIVDSNTPETDHEALSGGVVDILPQQDPTVAITEQIPPSTLPQSTEESFEINRDASSSMRIDDKLSVREVNVPPQDSPSADPELDQLTD